jgi:hypothetical protein
MSKNRNLSGGLFAAARPAPLTIKETPLSAQIAGWLDARGIYNDRLNCGRAKSPSGRWLTLCKAGTPDRFAVLRGQIVFIEVKMFGEKPSPEQLKKHEELRAAGAIVLVADSFELFKQLFSEIRAAIGEARGKGEINFYD